MLASVNRKKCPAQPQKSTINNWREPLHFDSQPTRAEICELLTPININNNYQQPSTKPSRGSMLINN